jgi:hypothetical protein
MSILSKENGAYWLHELKYGAEKSYQLKLAKLGKNTRSPGTPEHDEKIKLASKLETAKHTAGKIVGSEAEVFPLQDTYISDTISGKISGFNLSRATLSIRVGLQIADLITMRFCVIEFNKETQMMSTTDTIELAVDRPYEF